MIILLLGLIFRGVAFEFRHYAVGSKKLWDGGFVNGSIVVSFVEGAAIGAVLSGVPVENGQFSGERFFWVTPFAIFCGVGLACAYLLLGSTWLILKTSGPLQEKASRWAERVLPVVTIFVIAAIVYGLIFHDRRPGQLEGKLGLGASTFYRLGG